jgi:hypothetical protein
VTTTRRVVVAGVAVVAALVVAAPRASAQEEPGRRVDISFEVGTYDAVLGDFPITGVVVDGDLAEGEEITVELRGSGDQLVWTGSAAFRAPSTTIDVDPAVGVGEVTSAGLVQRLTPIVASLEVAPPEVFHSGGGGARSGQLALSMVVIVALFAILFRTPLPSASTQRWTR